MKMRAINIKGEWYSESEYRELLEKGLAKEDDWLCRFFNKISSLF